MALLARMCPGKHPEQTEGIKAEGWSLGDLCDLIRHLFVLLMSLNFIGGPFYRSVYQGLERWMLSQV